MSKKAEREKALAEGAKPRERNRSPITQAAAEVGRLANEVAELAEREQRALEKLESVAARRKDAEALLAKARQTLKERLPDDGGIA